MLRRILVEAAVLGAVFLALAVFPWDLAGVGREAAPAGRQGRALSASDLDLLRTRSLGLPVEGMEARRLRDSFDEARSGRDHEALDEAGGRRRRQGDGDRQPERHTRLVRGGEDAGGEGHDRRHRQVDLAVDDDEGHRHRHDHLLDRQPEQVHEVVDVEVDGRLRGVVDDRPDEDHRQQQLPGALAQGFRHRASPHWDSRR